MRGALTAHIPRLRPQVQTRLLSAACCWHAWPMVIRRVPCSARDLLRQEAKQKLDKMNVLNAQQLYQPHQVLRKD